MSSQTSDSGSQTQAWAEDSGLRSDPPDADVVARLDAGSVQASVLDYTGGLHTLDFRRKAWVPGRANRFAAADRVVLETLIESVTRVTSSVTLELLIHSRSSDAGGGSSVSQA